MSRHLHIVCLNAPYPADCGNSIDKFEKILALHNSGVNVHLHLLKCNDKVDAELNKHCENVNTYPNLDSSSNIESLVTHLNKNNFPVLIEDVYHPGILNSIERDKRKIVIRVQTENFHREEIDKGKKSFINLFFQKSHHKKKIRLPADLLYACISENHVISLRQKYHLPQVKLLLPFVTCREIKCGTGMGNFCLYHGNLSDPANEKMAIWLLEKVFSEIRFPFIIAGKNPSRRINKLAHLYSHTCIVANPSKEEIDDLVQKAHINIVPSFQPGKIYKLLHSLFEGRHCITNDMAVRNTNLAGACYIANDCRDKIEVIKHLITKPFTIDEIELRKNLLLSRYDNQKNVCRLLDWLY